jgi:hypothetical protein
MTVAAIALIPALSPSARADLQLQLAILPHLLSAHVTTSDETTEPRSNAAIASSRLRMAAAIGAPGSCPRPVDHNGARYQSLTGAYQSRGETRGSGKFLTLAPDGAAPLSIMVTDGVFSAGRTLRAGARITVVAYVRSSMSGAQPPFSCMELAS